MRIFYTLMLLLASGIVCGQQLVTRKNIVYASAIDWRNNKVDLKLDVIYPTHSKNLPLIVYMHGGGFDGGSKEYHKPICERLARSGFVVANVEYRQGFNRIPAIMLQEMIRAIYRSQMDEMSALRFMIENANDFPIDTSAIFLCGESAGAIATMFSTFAKPDEWDRISVVFHTNLSTVGKQDVSDLHYVKGVISMWGGIGDTALVSRQEMLSMPVLFFHSMSDEIVHFQHSNDAEKPDILFGSRDIADLYKRNHACYTFCYVKDAGHGFGFSSDYLATAISDFVGQVKNRECMEKEVENTAGTTSLSFNDPDSVALPVADEQIIKIQPDMLKQYSGTYKGNGMTVSIKVDGDHLIAQTQGSNQQNAIYPITKDIFIKKGTGIRALFERDDQGNVVEHIVVLNKQRELHYKKVE